MGEPADTGTDSRVRDYLHAWTVDQVSRWESNAVRDGELKFARYIRKSWQPRIDALYEGRAVLISRFELPREHPMSPKWGGDPGDHLVLTERDTIEPYDGPQPQMILNRKMRRAAGQRGRRLNGDTPQWGGV